MYLTGMNKKKKPQYFFYRRNKLHFMNRAVVCRVIFSIRVLQMTELISVQNCLFSVCVTLIEGLMQCKLFYIYRKKKTVSQ